MNDTDKQFTFIESKMDSPIPFGSQTPASPLSATSPRGFPISHIQMESMHQSHYNYQSDDDISISHSFANSTSDTLRAFLATDLDSSDALSGNPRHWEWKQVKTWLKKNNLKDMIRMFEDNAENHEINGEMLLNINVDSLFEDYKAAEYQFKRDGRSITKYQKEWTKLVLRSNRKELSNHDITIDDIMEMNRRINLFIEKWDRILWIEYFIDTNNDVPTAETFSEEWGLTTAVAAMYLNHYENKDTIKEKDLGDLFQDFDVYSNCVLWWYIIMSILKTHSARSLWLILERVAEITASNIAIQLLEKFQFDLTRFSHTKLDKVTQNVVCGSQYPICAALRIAKWFNDRAFYDVARSELWKEVAETYVESAIDYLQLVQSDHLATVLLEVKSNIDNLSALDMALKYKLRSFCANNRIERITTSVMNTYEFLKPKNYADAFEISSLSSKLIWAQMANKQFYFTPLGMYITTVSLYIFYLILFSWLSTHQFTVYGPMSNTEKIFWIINMGYILHEIQNFMLNGLHFYYSQTQNIFDSLICVVFLGSMITRIYALYTGPEDYKYCIGVDDPVSSDCWRDSRINTTFVILYSIATIVLWIGIVNFCVLSQRLGPMITMIFRMMNDIITFFTVMLILFFGFTFGLIFLMGDVHTDFTSPIESGITLLRAILGDFDFTLFAERSANDKVNDALILFGYLVMFIYLIIGSLVLLNLLIAMMAKTFEHVQHDNIAAIIFSRFEVAITLNSNPAFIPPPLNVLAMILVIIFYIIEIVIQSMVWIFCCDVCRNHMNGKKRIQFDLLLKIMPGWMKQRKLELDNQILYDNCGKTWTVMTNEGETECKITKYKQETGKHCLKFKNAVSINSSVEKRERWVLDILELSNQGLMNLEQFEHKIYINNEWTNRLYNYDSDKKHKSPYWICAYCKKFVEESNVAIKMLGWKLKAREIEMKIISRDSPVVCPSCYRVRLERARIALVWEIFSYWIYQLIVRPILFIVIGSVRVLKKVTHPSKIRNGLIHMRKATFGDSKSIHHQERHHWKKGEELEIHDRETNEWRTAVIVWRKGAKMGVNFIDDICNNQINIDVTQNMRNRLQGGVDEVLDIDNDKQRIQEILNPDLCNYHYRDWQLIEKFKNMFDDEEHADLFEEDESNIIWRLLHGAKNSIEPFVLKETIDGHILTLSKEHEIMPADFRHDYIGIDEIVKEGGYKLWDSYFQPFSDAIFNEIKQLTDNKVPLHLLSRYPFDVSLVLDDMHEHWNHMHNHHVSDYEYIQYKPDDITADDIINSLNNLKFLKCIDNTERETVVHIIQHAMDFYQTSNNDKDSNQLYHKFLVYLYQIQSLFQETRKIKNMIRDVSKAISQSDVCKTIFLDEIYFLFADVRNYVESIPFFRAMRTQEYENNEKPTVELWTIRNTLYVLYFLQHTVKQSIIENNSKIYVTKKDILKMIFEEFENDIIGNMNDIIELEMTENKNDRFNSDEMRKEQQKRIELFQKKQVTAVDVNKELSSIFEKIQTARENRITDSSITYYKRHLNISLLNDDESLKFIFEQLSRYCAFIDDKQLKKNIDASWLYKILHCTNFSDTYTIDEEMIPLSVNLKNTQKLHKHLLNILKQTKGFKQNLTVNVVLNIITVYYKIFCHLVKNQQVANEQFMVTHGHFCKFLDNHFDIESSREHWTAKTKAASNLFQSVLDSSKDVVTLGQINHTINQLINRVEDMECGGITRVMNHLYGQQKVCHKRSQTQRRVLLDDVKSIDTDYKLDTKHKLVEPLRHVRNIDDWEDFKKITSQTIAFGDSEKNTKFQMDHLNEEKWLQFIAKRSESYCKKQIRFIITDEKEQKQEEELCGILDDVLNSNANTDTDIDTVVEKKKVSHDQTSDKSQFEGILTTSTFNILQKRRENTKNIKPKKKSKLESIRKVVFRSALSFNSQRITLQQWYNFAKTFCEFLGTNEKVKNVMKRYLKAHDPIYEDEKKILQNYEFSQHINTRKKYFAESDEFKLEIDWLYEKTENLYELCQRIYPFWSAKILKEIYYLLESSEQIKGIYELKATQFTQLKYSLHVTNNELAYKLFDIIRFKRRTTSYNQFYAYFKFLLTAKYKIQKAIIDSRNAEDTTLSKDGLKNVLNRSLNDEAEWLFDKVQKIYGARITWKQISSYLKKTIRVRDDVRDFFNDKERDKTYEQRGAEVINKISDKQNEIKHELIKIRHSKNTENVNENHTLVAKMDLFMEQMKSLSVQVESLKNQMNEKTKPLVFME